MTEPKIAKLRTAMATGDWSLALRIAARWPRLGPDKAAIVRGHEALAHPDFYRQLGRDPDQLVEIAKAALLRRYGVKA